MTEYLPKQNLVSDEIEWQIISFFFYYPKRESEGYWSVSRLNKFKLNAEIPRIISLMHTR